jgi:hypothetical protein
MNGPLKLAATVATALAAAGTFSSADAQIMQTKVYGAPSGVDREFGKFAAISGNMAIISDGDFDIDMQGQDLNTGAAYLFDLTTQTQTHRLRSADREPGDLFGLSVAIGGDSAIVGAPAVDREGAAYVFDVATGAQRLKLTPAGSPQARAAGFGSAVAASGNNVVVGAVGRDAAYVFDATTGALTATLQPADGGGGVSDELFRFGVSAAIDGDFAVVGAEIKTILQSGELLTTGAVYLFDVTTGSQLARLTPSGGDDDDEFGFSVDISGETIVVGAPISDIGGNATGAAYLFDVTTGAQLARLISSDPDERDQFGTSVAISGNRAMVGEGRFAFPYGAGGSAHLFDATTGELLMRLTDPSGGPENLFGFSVGLSGNSAVIGAIFDDDRNVDAGAAYLLDFTEPFRWINPEGGEWSEGSNWDKGAAPMEDDDAIIGVDGTYAIDATETVDVRNLIVTSAEDFGSVTATIRSGFIEINANLVKIGTHTPGDLLTQNASLTLEGVGLTADHSALVGGMAVGAAQLNLGTSSGLTVNGPLTVGTLASRGTLSVGADAFVDAERLIVGQGPGDPAGEDSRVNVEGGVVNIHGRVTIGFAGQAVVQVKEGGQVAVGEGEGTEVGRNSLLFVEDEGSSWTSELAPLSVSNGYAVFFNGGRGKFSAGFVDFKQQEGDLFDALDVSNGELEFSGDLTVAVTQAASASIQEGGRLRAQNLLIGATPLPLPGSSIVAVRGGGSEAFLVDRAVLGFADDFGFRNDGSLAVIDGATVNAAGGGFTIAQGMLMVAGAGSEVTSLAGPLNVGNGSATFLAGARGSFGDVIVRGPATLGIGIPEGMAERLAVFTSPEALAQFLYSRASSALGIFDSTVDAESVVVGGDGRPGVIAMINGALNVSGVGGGEVRVENLGNVVGTGAINGTVNNVGGFVSPGLSPGVLAFDDYVQGPEGTLELEISGLAAGAQHDVLQVAGDANIDGTVLVRFINGFAPRQGQQFEFLTFGGAVDLTAASFEIQNLASGFEFDIAFAAGGVTLTALNDGVSLIDPIAGDYNTDGTVDAADYVLWRKSGASPEAYDEWRANFGSIAGAAASLMDASVPEPRGMILFAISLCAMAALRLRQPC